MNINYHYFAVKVLASYAEFNKEDAQLIASYSQFVDDFDTYRFLFFEEVPDYARYLAVPFPGGWLFNPVTTGFNSFFDYTRLAVESNQKRILIPFHFITKEPLTVKKQDRKEYRVIPVTMDQESLLQSLLLKASNLYKADHSRENIIRIGTLLHIFADTYAHQRFSGFWNWENHAYLEDVVNNINYENITSSYKPDFYFYVPSIGHPNVSTAPDDSFASLTMQQKYDQGENFPYKAHYSRSNPLEFLIASREILNYLRDCRGLGKIDDASWNTLAVKLKKGFLTTDTDVNKLAKHWSKIFPDIAFSYSKDKLFTDNIEIVDADGKEAAPESVRCIFNNKCLNDKNYLLSSQTEDFFRYNVIADNIRKAVDPEFNEDIDFIKYANEVRNKAQSTKNI